MSFSARYWAFYCRFLIYLVDIEWATLSGARSQHFSLISQCFLQLKIINFYMENSWKKTRKSKKKFKENPPSMFQTIHLSWFTILYNPSNPSKRIFPRDWKGKYIRLIIFCIIGFELFYGDFLWSWFFWDFKSNWWKRKWGPPCYPS